MKNLCLVAFLAVFSLVGVQAQDTSFGVTTGFHNLTVRASANGASASSGESGIFAGFFADIPVSDKLHVQPEVQYATIFADGDTGNEVVIPIMAKYYAAEQFFVQAGPVIDIIVDDSEGLNAFGFGLGVGAGYEFSDKIFATTRYSFGLNNRLEDDIFEEISVDTKFNIFQIGVGYKFN